MRRARALALTSSILAAPALAQAELSREGAVPAWCDEVRALLRAAPADGDQAWPRYLELAAKVPREADAVLEDARRRAGENGTLSGTLKALEIALADGCRPAPLIEDRPAMAEEVRAVLASDERFAGQRDEPDLLDTYKARLAAWLEELFESELMRRYAGASRAVYLTALALFVAFVAARLWRARARREEASKSALRSARIERERQERFEEHRREADAALAAGDLRGALRRGQLALLARIGEVVEGAVTPARTNREVLARLDERRRGIVAPPLGRFEVTFYGGLPLGPTLVASFLAEVDEAAAALGALAAGTGGER